MTNDSAALSPQSEQASKGVASTIFCGNFHNMGTFKHFFDKRPYFGWRDVVVAPFNNEQEEGACSVGEILFIPLAPEHYFRVFSCPAATPPCKSDVNLVFCTWPSLAPLRSSIYSCFTRGNVL